MDETTGANGGICMSISAMGIGFAFNNPQFSDRVLKIIAEDSLESKAGKCILSEALSCRVTTVHINSLILGSQSPFFFKMLSNGMKESKQQAVTILIKSSEESALLDLLEFMYTHKLKADAPAELLRVLVLADRYQVASCVASCAQALSSFPMTFKLALSCLNLPSTISEGENTHLSSLIDAAKCFLSKNFSRHYEEALELPLESVEKILSWDTLEVDSEDKVYDFLLDWMRTNYSDLGERRKVYGSQLCHLIRFPHMSCEKLKAVLQNEELELHDVTKMVSEALLSKFGSHLNYADATTTCRGRVYKLRPVEVVARPHNECIVFSMLKKEECITISKEFVGILTQMFNVWGESFCLEFRHALNYKSLFGVALKRWSSKSSTNAIKVEVEVAVRLKTVGKFKVVCTHLGALELKECIWLRICESWDLLLADDSEYFDNGALHVKVTIVVKH